MRVRERDLAQGSQEWLEWRRLGFGGSDIYVLACHADKLATALEVPRFRQLMPKTAPPKWIPSLSTLINRKLGIEPEQPPNFHMARGHRLEPVARAAAENRYGIEFDPFCVYPDDIPAVRVSLDGFNDNQGMLIEIKAPMHGWRAMPDYLEYQTAYQAEALRAEAMDKTIVRSVIGLTVHETGPSATDPVEVRAWQPTLWKNAGLCADLATMASLCHSTYVTGGKSMPEYFRYPPLLAPTRNQRARA